MNVNDEMIKNAIVAIGYTHDKKDIMVYMNPHTWLGNQVRSLSAESRGKFLKELEDVARLYLINNGKADPT